MEARELIEFIGNAEKKTPVKVYVKEREPVDFAGAGASVPLCGFGNTLAQGAIKAAGEQGWLGAITGGAIAAAGGVSAAIFFGYLNGVIFKPKSKR